MVHFNYNFHCSISLSTNGMEKGAGLTVKKPYSVLLDQTTNLLLCTGFLSSFTNAKMIKGKARKANHNKKTNIEVGQSQRGRRSNEQALQDLAKVN